MIQKRTFFLLGVLTGVFLTLVSLRRALDRLAEKDALDRKVAAIHAEQNAEYQEWWDSLPTDRKIDITLRQTERKKRLEEDQDGGPYDAPQP